MGGGAGGRGAWGAAGWGARAGRGLELHVSAWADPHSEGVRSGQPRSAAVGSPAEQTFPVGRCSY